LGLKSFAPEKKNERKKKKSKKEKKGMETSERERTGGDKNEAENGKRKIRPSSDSVCELVRGKATRVWSTSAFGGGSEG
jgi:hypothetical protein